MVAMIEVPIVEALAEAEIVQANEISGWTHIQVWCGGTTVNTYTAGTGNDGTWAETGVWSVSDEEGRPVGAEEMKRHMAMHWEIIAEEEA